MKLARNQLYFVVLMIIILIVAIVIFIPQILTLVKGAFNIVSPPSSEKEEVVKGIPHQTLGIDDSDSSDIMVYKLFRNFDSEFLHEDKSNKIFYNAFTLELKVKYYGDGTPGYGSTFINNITQGLKDFNKVNDLFQIGNNLNPNCGAITPNNSIDFFSNDCWHSSLDIEPSPCKIYIKSYTRQSINYHEFRGRVKIRVVWYKSGGKSNNKQVIHPIITICNDNSMLL